MFLIFFLELNAKSINWHMDMPEQVFRINNASALAGHVIHEGISLNFNNVEIIVREYI